MIALILAVLGLTVAPQSNVGDASPETVGGYGSPSELAVAQLGRASRGRGDTVGGVMPAEGDPALTVPPAVSSEATVEGKATWYDYFEGQAAAGPALRQALGSDWRGQRVTVCSGECVTVRLSDWCLCGHGRVVDLDRRDFARLADPGRGVIPVAVSVDAPSPTLPPTDMEEQP